MVREMLVVEFARYMVTADVELAVVTAVAAKENAANVCEGGSHQVKRVRRNGNRKASKHIRQPYQPFGAASAGATALG